MKSGRPLMLVPLVFLLSLLGILVAPSAVAAPPQSGYDCATEPYIAPVEAMPEPFLKFPFPKAVKHEAVITQGWIVSQDEELFVGAGVHGALDVELERSDNGFGVPVLASAAGCAYSSYQSFYCDDYIDANGVPHTIGCGAGLFVEIIHDNGWITQYVHLDSVAPGIPHRPATPVTTPDGSVVPGVWRPDIFMSSVELKRHGVRVQQGQVVGSNGDTGIMLDYVEAYDPSTGTVAPRDRQQFPNWESLTDLNGESPAQLHLAVYAGRNEAGSRQRIVDPLDIYGQITEQNDPYNLGHGRFNLGPANLFLTHGHSNRLVFADG